MYLFYKSALTWLGSTSDVRNSCIREQFIKIDSLVNELNTIAPEGDRRFRSIRNDLAGLLVVSLASTYENCVKTILIAYADLFHDKFSHQVEKKYSYLNSKIKSNSLTEYLSHFDGSVSFFQDRLKYVSGKMRTEIDKSYDQILTWRHSFAHANKSMTSINDAYKAHRYGKHVLYAFEDALLGHVLREHRKSIVNIFDNAKSISDATRRSAELIAAVHKENALNAPQIAAASKSADNSDYYLSLIADDYTKSLNADVYDIMKIYELVTLSFSEVKSCAKMCSQVKRSIVT